MPELSATKMVETGLLEDDQPVYFWAVGALLKAVRFEASFSPQSHPFSVPEKLNHSVLSPMSASHLSDLLPIPTGIEEPNAYQVFGLAAGEPDNATVKAAVKQVIKDLKASKKTTDRQLWKQAAKIAENARATLNDPSQRAALDALLGITATSASFAPPSGLPPGIAPPPAPVVDPLASVLPSSDPLAGMLPNQTPPGQAPLGQAPLGQAPLGQAPLAPMAPAQAAVGTYPGQPMMPPTPVGPHNPAAPMPPAPGQIQAHTLSPPQPIPPAIPAAPNVPAVPLAPNGYAQPSVPGGIPVAPAPSTAAPTPVPEAVSPKLSGTPVFKAKKRRRKKSDSTKVILVTSACVLAALIGGLGVFAAVGPGFAVNEDGEVAMRDPAKEKSQREKQKAAAGTDATDASQSRQRRRQKTASKQVI